MGKPRRTATKRQPNLDRPVDDARFAILRDEGEARGVLGSRIHGVSHDAPSVEYGGLDAV